MGFGFNLFVIFILPVALLISTIAAIYFLLKKEHKLLKWLLISWGIFFSMAVLLIGTVYAIHFFTYKTNVYQQDVYGGYVIDKTKYAGKEANWQYDHYRFEITKHDSLLFHVTDKKAILKTYRGKVQYVKGGRIILKVNMPRSAVIVDTPILYRKTFSFYYVFRSKCYNNIFFKKGKWSE